LFCHDNDDDLNNVTSEIILKMKERRRFGTARVFLLSTQKIM
jgi:hypothetical protein